MSANTITRKALFQYGFIAAPVAFAGFPLYILAPDFYATHYGVSLTLLGTLLLFVRLFDAIQDPIIGWFTDKLQGQLFHTMVAAGIALCLAIYGLFNHVLFSPSVWFLICVLVAVTAYSLLTIALGVHGTLWTQNAEDQTRIASAREAFGLFGLVVAVTAPVALVQFGKSLNPYMWYSVLLAGLMALGIWNFSKLVNLGQKGGQVTTNHASLWHVISAWKALPSESIKLLVVYLISMLASSIPSVLVIFYVRDFLGAEKLVGIFLLLYFLTGAASMPLWKMLSVRFGKYNAWFLANLVAVIGFIGATFLNPGDISLYAVICVGSGLAFGADLSLPPSILADHIHTHNNRSYAASHYALLALLVKASLAIASVMVLPFLDWAGFAPNENNSEFSLTVLSLTYSIFPCLLKTMAAGMLYVFFIKSSSGVKNEHHQNGGANHDAN